MHSQSRSLAIVMFVMCISSVGVAHANCSSLPELPAVFAEQQMTTDQLSPLRDQFENTHLLLSNHIVCVEEQMQALPFPEIDGAPAQEGTPAASAYQSQFDGYAQQLDLVEQRRQTLDQQYNRLIETAVAEGQ